MQSAVTNSESNTPVPRHWLARSLTWKLWLPVGAMVLAAAGALMYRDSRLSAIPDIGDPFDVRGFSDVSIEPAENAWLDYEAAGALLVPRPQGLWEEVDATLDGSWGDATPGVRQWLVVNQPTLQRWRIGTAKERALRVQPDEVTVENYSGGILDQQAVIELAQLEALRCEAGGDIAGEWEWIRALFRFSRHVGMFDTEVQRLIGMVAHHQAIRRASHWSNLGQVTGEQLQTALRDVQADYRLTAPTSIVVKFEYLIAVDGLNRVEELRASHGRVADDFGRPDLVVPSRPVLFLAHEPELTRRLLQHQTANLLQHVDQAACDQPRRIRNLTFFDVAPPPGSRVLVPAEFQSQCSRAPLAGTHLLRSIPIGFCIQEKAEQSALEVMLAAQHFRREFGELPESLSQAVVAGMLPKIPRDPWGKSGVELRYERDATDPLRAKVWSIGANHTDDGGSIESREFGVGDEGLWIGEPPRAE